MRVLLTQKFKRTLAVKYPRGQSKVAALFGFDRHQLSALLHDAYGIGPVTRARFVKLGAHLGLAEAEIFRAVPRD